MATKILFNKIKRKIENAFHVNNGFSNKDKNKLKKLERYQPCTIFFLGKKLKIVDADTFLASYHEIFEKEIYKFISTKKDIVIIDCGANIGLATIYFKLNFPGAKIIAFEPDPYISKTFEENIKSFGYHDVLCKNQAISNRDEIINFRLEGGHSGMMTKIEDKGTVKVEAIRLKTFLNSYDNITFLKIDIEGEEVNVIPDIAEELLKVDFLFVEYHSFLDLPQKLDELLVSIKKAGMRYYIKEATNKLDPFINKEIFLKMDLLVNIFCYR